MDGLKAESGERIVQARVDTFFESAEQVAKAKDLAHILPTLSSRLPDEASRKLAFGLACSVVMADKRAHPQELAVLKALQNAFDIRESEVVELFEAAENHAPLPPTKT